VPLQTAVNLHLSSGGIERLAVVPPAIWSAKVQASISGTALADHPMTQVDASVHRAV
jgi:hypothetical protein